MKRSVSSNYLSPCFAPTQIFVATIAFLLPSAEHSTVEADKKVHAGKEGTWNGRDLRALDLSCWNGVVAEECFYCFSTVLLSFISLYFLSWQPSFITCCFSGTVLLFFFFCSINILISFVLFWCWMTELKKRNLSLLSHLISWWSHCCFACWTGAWLFPWVCYWNRSPCLWWRTAHPIRPRCWTTSTGWVVSLATKSCSYQQTCFPISSETYNVVARRHINFSFDTSTPPSYQMGLLL